MSVIFRLIIDKILWVTLIIFAMPTILILLSWNAKPGDSNYAIKAGLENMVYPTSQVVSFKK
jgi:hypothetical protein